ncbi:MAG: hypothetical protein HKN13_03710 [Rhodothermales bacterium]|nr:hypothetical protein [Rhodothermales bacterium]
MRSAAIVVRISNVHYRFEVPPMVSVASLWLPILLSAVLVFVVSSLIHMVLKYHQSDFGQVPREDDVMSALREFNIPPGDYFMPYASDTKESQKPEFVEKQNAGPNLVMTVIANGPINMGSSLVQWFVYSLVVGLFAAYVASRALGPGAEYLDVFQFTGTVAFAGYSLALLQSSIWWKKAWSSTIKSVLDGLIYALCTAGVFGWLWP